MLDGGASLTLDKRLAGRVGDRRRVGRCGGGAAAADADVAARPGARLGRLRRRSAPTSPPACLSMAARGEGAGDRADPDRRSGDRGHAGAAGQSRACRCRPARCSRRGTGSIAGRSATGARGATTSKPRRATLVPAIGDVLDWLRRAARRDLRAHVGQRGDLLRLVRRRGGARCGGGGLSRIMVASRDLPALRRAHHDATDPHRRSDARRRASRDRCAALDRDAVERAGAALARAVRRFVGPRETLVLCGPGNNGADGGRGAASCRAPVYAVRDRRRCDDAGAVEPLEPAPMLIDCLFGTGLNRGLDDAVSANSFCALRVEHARDHRLRPAERRVERRRRAAVADSRSADLTVTFGALKPAHRLMPAMAHMGRVVVADIGDRSRERLVRDRRAACCRRSTRRGTNIAAGWSIALPGKMPGRDRPCGARRGGRGRGLCPRVDHVAAIDNLPSAIVQTDTAADQRPARRRDPGRAGDGRHPADPDAGADRDAPGDHRRRRASARVGEPERLIGHDAILTPHEGEFVKLFGELAGQQGRARAGGGAASRSVVVYKGPDTLVAAPDGRLGFAPPAPAWLASAGTGDVLAGIIAALRARGMPSFEAACAAVWLHGRAAERRRAGDDRRRPGRGASRHASPTWMSDPIVRIAARGDGVSAGGRHRRLRRARATSSPPTGR